MHTFSFYKCISLCLVVLLIATTPLSAYAAPRAYVTNTSDDTVSVISIPNNEVITTISVGDLPYYVAVNGTGAYVANYTAGTVSVIDITNHSVEATISVGDGPSLIAINGTGAYVSNTSGDTISVIDMTDNQVDVTISTGDAPRGIAFSGTGMYVANIVDDNLSVFDTTDNQLVTNVAMGNAPYHVVINGTGAYVTNSSDDSVSVMDITDNQIVTTISVGSLPYSIASSGTGVYTTNQGTSIVTVIDVTDNQIVTTIPVGVNTSHISIYGTGAYVANRNENSLSVIDISDNQVVTEVSIGTSPHGVAVGGTFAPTASSLSPVDDGTDIAISANLILEFSHPISRAGTGTVSIYKASDDSLVEQISVTGSLVTGSGTDTITINPSVTLTNSTDYYVQISEDAFPDFYDDYYTGISNTTAWNFTTVALPSSSSSSSSTSSSTSLPGGGVREITLEMKQQAAALRFGTAFNPLASSASSSARSGYFHDVPISAWFYTFVEHMRQKGVISGYKDSSGQETQLFGPGDPVTYGQLAKMISLLTKRSPTNMESLQHWAEPYVREARLYNLSEFADETLHLDTNVTRGVAIRTILEAYGISLDALPQSAFTDLPQSHPYTNTLLTATVLGIISGDEGESTIRPDAHVNRAELAKILMGVSEKFTPKIIQRSSASSASSSAQSSSSVSSTSLSSNIGKDLRYVTSPLLHVRSDARITSAILWTAKQGQEFEVLRIVSDDWAHVRVADGNEGYVWVYYLGEL